MILQLSAIANLAQRYTMSNNSCITINCRFTFPPTLSTVEIQHTLSPMQARPRTWKQGSVKLLHYCSRGIWEIWQARSTVLRPPLLPSDSAMRFELWLVVCY